MHPKMMLILFSSWCTLDEACYNTACSVDWLEQLVSLEADAKRD